MFPACIRAWAFSLAGQTSSVFAAWAFAGGDCARGRCSRSNGACTRIPADGLLAVADGSVFQGPVPGEQRVPALFLARGTGINCGQNLDHGGRKDPMQQRSTTRKMQATACTVLAAATTLVLPAAAQEIKIGFSMAMTGGLGPNGKSALLAQKIWEEDVNAKGGLLGRPVKLVYYDDQTNPSTVPGIYTKLLDVDKVDLIIGGYGTNMLAPAMPLVMQRKKLFIGLLGLGVNSEFNYPNYFIMIPSGPDPKTRSPRISSTRRRRRPQAADHRDRRGRCRVRAQRRRRRPRERQESTASRSSTTRTTRRPPDFAPIVRAIAAANPAPGHLLLSARLGRHGARHQRDRLQAQDDGRRHGRPAEHLDQDAAGPAAQRLRHLRFLAAGAQNGVPRRHRPDQQVSGERGGARASTRSATTWRRKRMPSCRLFSRP